MKFKGRGIALTIALMAYSQTIMANPTGGIVAVGSAVINQDNPNHTIVTQTTPKAIINWQNFDIGAHQITQFIQPGMDSIILNRIHSNSPSQIFGQLTANGNVVLINPNGIHFANGSSVNVAGLFAFTANITDQEFMREHAIGEGYQFKQDPQKNAGIINDGHIKVKDSGMVALVAPGVKNTGIIEGNLSTIEIGSGKEFTINFDGRDLIHFATGQSADNIAPVGPNGEVLKSAIDLDQKGEIKGNAAKVKVKVSDAQRIVEKVINMDGIIKADSITVDRNGEIHLISQNTQRGIIEVSGKMSAKGTGKNTKGGEIIITGNKVGLVNKAELDVSGMTGGGNIFVGGDYKGNLDPTKIFHKAYVLPNSKAIFGGKEVIMKANALERGHGGKIICWSDDATRMHSTIEAKAGPLGGNGGFIETSGKFLDVQGIKVTANAALGKAGTWLLDPFDITISAAATNPAAGTSPNYVSNNVGANINTADIANTLEAGTSVSITTGPGGAQTGNITFAIGSNISKTLGGPASLTLIASDSIIINNFVKITDATNNLTFNMQAQGNVNFGSNGVSVIVNSASITANNFNNSTSLDPNSFVTQSLTLNVNTCNFFGTVGGSTDANFLKNPQNTPHIIDGNPAHPYPIPASDPPTTVNYFSPLGTHFMNGGNDLFFTLTGPLAPPTPPPTPTPPTPTQVVPPQIPNSISPPPLPSGVSGGPTAPPPITPENPLTVGGTDSTSGSSSSSGSSSTSSGSSSTSGTGSSGSGSTSGSSSSSSSSTSGSSSGSSSTVSDSGSGSSSTVNSTSGSDSSSATSSSSTSHADSTSSGGQSTSHSTGNVPIGGDSGPGQEVAPKSNVGSEAKPPNPEMSSGVSDLKGEPVSKPSCGKGSDPQGPSCAPGVKSTEAPVDRTLQKSNSVSPTGIAGTDVPMGTAGIGGSKEGREINTSLQAEEEAAMRGLLRNGIVDTLQKTRVIQTGVSGYTPEILPPEEQLMQELEADRKNLTHRNIILAPIP